MTDFAGRPIVMFFYPRADTPGCTAEAQDFSERAAAFAAARAELIGISADSPQKLARFREKHALGMILLSDETHSVLNAYGVWGEKMMYGKRFEGILRTTFLIGRDRRIVKIWRGVKVPGHAAAVLQDVQQIA